MCGKRIFTKKDAEVALKRVAKSRNKRRKEIRSYYCKLCNGWHLTSQEYKFDNPTEDLKLSFESKWNEILEAS